MPKTFLNLCQDMQQEVGYAGGVGLNSVVGQTDQYAKIVYWIQESDIYIQGLWTNWRFLSNEFSGTLTQGSDLVPLPTAHTIKELDRCSLGITVSAGNVHFPAWMEWEDYRRAYHYEAQTATNYPAYWSQGPDGQIYLSAPPSSAGLAFRYFYWRRPERMALDADESPIPDDYRRVILCRAKVMYAEHEDAPEVDAGAAAEYVDLLEKLQGSELPGQRGSRMSQLDIGMVEYPG